MGDRGGVVADTVGAFVRSFTLEVAEGSLRALRIHP